MNQIDLAGRQAVITGGAQGIGRAIAERFIASGAFVTIWDVDRALSERTCEELGDQSSHITVDLTDWDAVRSAAARSQAEMGRVDILVNNAGIAGANATVAETDPAEWRKVIDLDLTG
ncbi:MAG: SDR family NAD(P)-dependent oxidoreductase, partial [Pseudomonadota bacterium]